MAQGFDEILDDLKLMKDPVIQERAVASVFPEHFQRIFIKNLDSSGADLPPLSTKEIYINTAKDSPKKLAPRGKDGNRKFKNGKTKVTTYFSGGYAQFKQEIDRPKLELFGDMRKSYVFGWFNGKLSYGFTNKAEADKAEWNEDNTGRTIFAKTQAEIDRFVQIYTNLLGL